MTVFRKGEGWDVALGSDRYRVLVISSDMFNLDSGLPHLLAMEVRDEPGPYVVGQSGDLIHRLTVGFDAVHLTAQTLPDQLVDLLHRHHAGRSFTSPRRVLSLANNLRHASGPCALTCRAINRHDARV